MTRMFALAGASLLAVASATASHAQSSDDSDEAVDDRIIVTTQKREEAAFDVPITLTAYDEQQLRVFDVEAFDDLSDFVPGLNVQLQSPNNPGWVIRGITTDSGNFQDPPRISVYLNGVDVSRSRGSAFELFDIERVEVAKGPQATLFGTAASVGAISVITAKPEQEFGASAYASYGSYNFVKVGGHVTGGTDILQGRLAAQYRARDGYVSNLAPGEDDLQGIETIAIRPSLRFTPTDDFTADLVFNYERNTPPATAFKSGAIAPPGGDTDPNTFAFLNGPFDNNLLEFGGFNAIQIPGVPQPVLQPILTPLDPGAIADLIGSDELGLERDIYDVNLTADWTIGNGFSLTGVLGYRELDSLEVFDADGSFVPYIETAENVEAEQENYELRVNFDRGGRFRGFAGVNYFTEDGFQRVPFALDETVFLACQTPGLGLAACVNPNGTFNRFNIDPATAQTQPLVPSVLPDGTPTFGVYYPAEFRTTGETDSLSVFADLTVDVTPKLELTAGVRYLEEDRSSGFISDFPISLVATQLFGTPSILLQGSANTDGQEVSESLEDDDILPRFNALYRVNDNLNVYASIAKGRRAPVFSITQAAAVDENGQPIVNPQTGNVVPAIEQVPEEIVWNYEAGLKAELLGGLAAVEAAVFLQEYQDFRVQTSTVQGGDILIQNESAGSADNLGFEFSGTLAPTDALTLIATFAYIDAEIDDDASNGDLAGRQFRLQPETSGSFTADYRTPILDAFEVFGTLNYAYRSEVFFERDNAPEFSQDALGLVDLRLGVGELNGLWEVSVFGENVFDEDYIIDAGNTGRIFGTPTFIAGPPALWGVELRGQF